mmetsp:Transcript_11397/g.32262  ORF Transcript_11397/g.32262 Transcript_11397/m.32262 type:complete len:268 (+) Transcript_11397:1251-2054(+)
MQRAPPPQAANARMRRSKLGVSHSQSARRPMRAQVLRRTRNRSTTSRSKRPGVSHESTHKYVRISLEGVGDRHGINLQHPPVQEHVHKSRLGRGTVSVEVLPLLGPLGNAGVGNDVRGPDMSQAHANTVRCACRQTERDDGPECRRGRGRGEKAQSSARGGDATSSQQSIDRTEAKAAMEILGLVGIGGSARLTALAAHTLVVMLTVGVTVAIVIEGVAGIAIAEPMLRQFLPLPRADVEVGGGSHRTTRTRGRVVSVLAGMMMMVM